jgi:prepilin-type N-terminal cleavage/methylation domain-containing protein
MRKRGGFTLVELMVAMALTLFVMAILTQAFVVGIDTFTGLKGIGDMQEALRVASNNLRNDLRQNHFEGSRRLSDDPSLGPPREGFFLVMHPSPPNYLSYPYPSTASQSGFTGPRPTPPFSTANPPVPYLYEGFDSDGIESVRAVDHILNFTCRLTGNRPESYYRATLADDPALTPNPGPPFSPFAAQQFVNTQTHPFLSANDYSDATQRDVQSVYPWIQTYNSQWAEVAYYLVQTGSTEEPENPTSALGMPLFGLYRAQYVFVPFDSNVDSLFAFGAGSTATYKEPVPGYYLSVFGDMACNGNPATKTIDFYKPSDLALDPATANGPAFFQSTFLTRVRLANSIKDPILKGSLLLPNVVSFRVQLLRQPLQTGAKFDDVIPQGRAPYNLVLANGTSGYNPLNMNYPYCIAPFNGTWADRNACYDSRNRYTGNSDNRKGPIDGIQSGPVYAVQIILRVWEPKTRQTRQLTIIQDL